VVSCLQGLAFVVVVGGCMIGLGFLCYRSILITALLEAQDKPGEDGGLLLKVKEKGHDGLRSLYYESIYSMARVPVV